MGEVRRYFRDASWAVRVPRRMKELHLMIRRAVGELSQRLGRAPSAAEIAAELDIDIDIEEVSQGLLAGNAYQTLSVDATVGGDGDRTPLVETIGQYDDALERVENHEALQPVLAALPERERNVLMLRFFGSLTQTQIAERMGISQMHVSRLLSRTLEQLRGQLSEE